jgi:hypothetical protein
MNLQMMVIVYYNTYHHKITGTNSWCQANLPRFIGPQTAANDTESFTGKGF